MAISGTQSEGIYMQEVIYLTAFILLTKGIIGLLVNEFIFNWGRVGTLVFANLSGII